MSADEPRSSVPQPTMAPQVWSLKGKDGQTLRADPNRGQRIPPRTLVGDKYLVGEVLGRGSFSTVYAAEQRPMGRAVALKVAAAAEDPVVRERFVREARFLAALAHPNIVRVYELGVLPHGATVIVMEQLHGETVEQRVLREGPLPVADVVSILEEVLEAIAEVHRAGIVHRDLKPANVFLMARGEPRTRVLDFGIGRSTGDAQRLTAVGQLVGTPAYLSPEQLLPTGELDARSDLYTLGALAFRALTGRVPFEGTGPQVIAKVVRDVPPRVGALREGIPPRLDAFVARALSKSPEDRFQSADEMRVVLGALGA